jgi:hypothetical protein
VEIGQKAEICRRRRIRTVSAPLAENPAEAPSMRVGPPLGQDRDPLPSLGSLMALGGGTGIRDQLAHVGHMATAATATGPWWVC